MKIINCQTNHITNPIGFQMEQPVFSWLVCDAEGKKQTAARIIVAADSMFEKICLDTGWKESIDSLGTMAELTLRPHTRYLWKVMVQTDKEGETAESGTNYFETGKLQEPWQGEWISCEEGGRHPIFEKEFRLEPGLKLRSARLYICGLGLYEAYLNGSRISDEYMAPYCNNYRKWVQYQTYDVTGLFETDAPGKGHKLSVMLGNGWYKGRFGYFSKPGDKGMYGNRYALIAELRLDYEDGSSTVIGTDESWRVTRSNLTFSNIYDGERRDDTLPSAETEKPFILSKEEAPAAPLCAHASLEWCQKAVLIERYSLPVRIFDRVKPVELIHTPAGELVFDMGQNLVGTFILRVNRPRGTVVHIQMGEVLQNGCFYNENLRTAKAEYYYTSNGQEIFLQPHFTFYGYRYVRIEGIPELSKDDFEALVMYSELPATGKLRTGQKKVNRLIQNVEWGQKGNFLDVPTDCPQRDERLGWTGDAQVFSATACFLRNCYPFYRKYLYDMLSEQKMLDGMVPDIIPSLDDTYRSCSSVWGDAACIIPWNMYLFYGDKTVLRESYGNMKLWVEYVRNYDGGSGAWWEHFHYGDWLALDRPNRKEDTCLGGTDEVYIAKIYYRNDLDILAKTAALIGKEEDAEEYRMLADEMLQEIRDEYMTPVGRTSIDTQTGILLALQYGLVRKPEAGRTRLMQKLRETGGRLQTGFVGTPFLNLQLTKAGISTHPGLEAYAYNLLLNEEYPGWLYEVNLGGTTIWERWNSLNADGSISSTGMNSFNHYSYGAIAEWMCRYMAGLNPKEDAPGFRKAEITPVPDMRVGYVDFSYTSAAGKYHIFWKAEDERHLTLSVTVPFGCEAVLRLPYAGKDTCMAYHADEAGIMNLTAGSYEFTYETTKPMRPIYSLDSRLWDIAMSRQASDILEEAIPGVLALNTMYYKTVNEIKSDPRLRRLTDQELDTLNRKLKESM